MSGKLFEYAVLFHHKAKKVEGVEHTQTADLIVDVKRLIAKDDKTVAMLAARAIPEEYLDKLDQCEIIIRPF